jgi:polyvinyl alcohol dehydrogenase (cytochrome)
MVLTAAMAAAGPESAPQQDIESAVLGRDPARESTPGAALFRQHCAVCHNGRVSRAPQRTFIEMMKPKQLFSVLEHGVMRQQASALTESERRQIVEYLAGPETAAPPTAPACNPARARFDYSKQPVAVGWGLDERNTRFIPADVARLAPAEVPRLALKWAFAFPSSTRARSQPAILGGEVIAGSEDGTVWALEQETGCLRWSFQAGGEVRTGITVRPWSAVKGRDQVIGYFTDLFARAYALDLVTGKLVWTVKVDEHPSATGTAQPTLYGDRLYVPVSSIETVPAADPTYACCSFRGSVVALNAMTGAIEWRTYSIPDAPKETGRNKIGTPILSPSGAPIWTSPTVDSRRGLLYVGTGENYSTPSNDTSDAVLALEIATGRIRWSFQGTRGDAWNLACMPFVSDKTNCPVENGPDLDFGSPPALLRVDGRDVLVAGQKSGVIWGLDPASGKLLWQRKLGRGGNQGGEHFGLAAEGRRAFIPISDFDDKMLPVSEARPGLYALDARSGDLLWSTPAPGDGCQGKVDCNTGISQAITAIPGIVFAGHMDGRLRAYDSISGKVVWQIDAEQRWNTVSGETARGGSFGGGAGPIVADGSVYASSGYGLLGHQPGNVLLVFSVDGK